MGETTKITVIKNIFYRIARGKGLINTSLFVLICILGGFLLLGIIGIVAGFAEKIFFIIPVVWDVIRKPLIWLWHLIGYIFIAITVAYLFQSIINYCNRILSALNEIASTQRDILKKLSDVQNAIVFSSTERIHRDKRNFNDEQIR